MPGYPLIANLSYNLTGTLGGYSELIGHVYILLNDSIPGLVKVGKTTGETDDRAAALSSATGVAAAFQVFKSYRVSDCDAAEVLAHRVLERAVGRPNNRREFFNGPAEVVSSILDDALAPYIESSPGDEMVAYFSEAVRRFSRKDYTISCMEFEAALPRVGSASMTYLMNKYLIRILGTYLAACASAGRAPIMQHCLFDPMLKGAVMERALDAMQGSSTDPAAELLSFVRALTN